MSGQRAGRIQIRARTYKHLRGFYVSESGFDGFLGAVFCKTREGAEVVKAALWSKRYAEESVRGWCGCAPATALAISKARASAAEASAVISSVLLSGY